MTEQIINYKWTKTGAEGQTNNHSFQIQVIKDSIIRIRYSFKKNMEKNLSYAVICSENQDNTAEYFADEWKKAEPGMVYKEELDGKILIQAGRISAEIRKKPFSIW